MGVCLPVYHKATIEVSARALKVPAVISRSNSEDPLLSSVMWLLTSLRFLLAVFCSFLPCGSLHSSKQCRLSQIQQGKREQERAQSKSETIKNLIADVTSHYFCHTLFIKSETVTLAQTQGLGITRCHEWQDVGTLGSHLRGFPRQRWLLALEIEYVGRQYIVCFIYLKSVLIMRQWGRVYYHWKTDLLPADLQSSSSFIT